MTAAHRPLRVAMVVDRFPREPFIAQQVAQLLERGIEVHIVCQIRDAASELWTDLQHLNRDRVHPWPDRGRRTELAAAAATVMTRTALTRPRRLLAAIGAERRGGADRRELAGRVLFDARILAIDPDVVHFQFGDLARHRTHLADAVDAAFTASFRGYDLTYSGLDQADFYDRLWPRLDAAHTLGHDLQRAARDRGCPPTMTWTLIPPAVDLGRFEAPSRDDRVDGSSRAYRVVSVGRLHWKKGLSDGLAAIAAIKAAGQTVCYRVVGAGPDEEQLRWAIGDLGLSRQVELLGHRDGPGVRDQLRWADALLHPALTEGFGNAVLEAQAMRLPVVCTDAEGLGENVVHNRTGLVVPRRRPDLMAEALLRLIKDRPLALEMGRQGRLRVEQQFGLHAQTDAFVDFFNSAVARRTGKAGTEPSRR